MTDAKICPRCATRYEGNVDFCSVDGSPLEGLVAKTEGSDTLVGTIVDGRYRVDAQIGEGGMGLVYSATHTTIQKKLALKVLRADMAREPEVVQRFVQEAQSASSIGHENIIDISDFGRLPDGSVYFVMEFLDGDPLIKLIEKGGSFPAKDALSIIKQIASALGAAHERGIVHRDLKPENIYVLRRGDAPFVKVLDFGIAKVGGASSKLTKTGMIFGTPHYMAPEQAAGSAVDARTDIYALGVIMYELFTSKVPFDSDSFMGILSKQMFEAPPPFSTHIKRNLGALEEITMRALRKKPDERFQSMREFVTELGRVSLTGTLANAEALGTPGGIADAIEAKSRTEMNVEVSLVAQHDRKPWIAAGVLCVVGVIAAGVLMSMRERDSATEAAAPPSIAPPPSAVAIVPEPPSAPLPSPTPALLAPISARTMALSSDPPNAEVLIAGALVGTTPVDVALPSTGERTVEVHLAGFAPKTVLVTPASPATLRVHLEPEAQKRAVSTPSRARPGASPGSPPAPQRSNSTSEIADPWATR